MRGFIDSKEKPRLESAEDHKQVRSNNNNLSCGDSKIVPWRSPVAQDVNESYMKAGFLDLKEV